MQLGDRVADRKYKRIDFAAWGIALGVAIILDILLIAAVLFWGPIVIRAVFGRNGFAPF